MQHTLLPNNLEDYVSEENPVRVIEVFIGSALGRVPGLSRQSFSSVELRFSCDSAAQAPNTRSALGRATQYLLSFDCDALTFRTEGRFRCGSSRPLPGGTTEMGQEDPSQLQRLGDREAPKAAVRLTTSDGSSRPSDL